MLFFSILIFLGHLFHVITSSWHLVWHDCSIHTLPIHTSVLELKRLKPTSQALIQGNLLSTRDAPIPVPVSVPIPGLSTLLQCVLIPWHRYQMYMYAYDSYALGQSWNPRSTGGSWSQWIARRERESMGLQRDLAPATPRNRQNFLGTLAPLPPATIHPPPSTKFPCSSDTIQRNVIYEKNNKSK